MLNHGFPDITMKPANNEVGRFANMSPVTEMVSRGRSSWTGGTAWVRRDGGLVKSEEDRMEEDCRFLVRIGLETRMDVDDKCRADRRERAPKKG
jgi:hypothetical protein